MCQGWDFGALGVPRGSKKSVTMSILKVLCQTLCMVSQIKDRKHIEQNFHFVARVMPQGWDFGKLGGGKKL